MLLRACLVLFVATSGFAQQHGANTQGGDRQVRLEDIERDNLNSQKPPTTGTQQVQYTPAGAGANHQQPHHQHQLSQQQLAAYQQQLLLQQLQNQYFSPTPITYSNLGGVPLMIIPNNQLGVGQTGLPIQAYYIPQLDQPLVSQPILAQPPPAAANQFYHQPQSQVYIPQQRFQQPQFQQVQKPQQPTVQRLQQITQPSVPPKDGPFLPSLPVQQQPGPVAYRPQQQYTFPGNNFVYNSPPAQLHQQHQFVYNQPPQAYNTYNALYQQRPQKTTFTSGIKSTATPPLKPSSQVYVPGSTPQTVTDPQSQSYVNYKSF